jgi:predicted pyridoxine 5'-phosphate oxidase superfamily flavin-nucleotide-binding protein
VACVRLGVSYAQTRPPNHDRCGPLSDDAVAFIQEQAFLIVATANAAGDADCSYRGRQPRADGSFAPLVHVADRRTLVLPDFAGNNLFNTIGNLLVNPSIALLFVDFVRQTTWLVQGRATVDEDAASHAQPARCAALRGRRGGARAGTRGCAAATAGAGVTRRGAGVVSSDR